MSASKLLQRTMGFSGRSPRTALDVQKNSHSCFPTVIHVCTTLQFLPRLYTTRIMIYLILFSLLALY